MNIYFYHLFPQVLLFLMVVLDYHIELLFQMLLFLLVFHIPSILFLLLYLLVLIYIPIIINRYYYSFISYFVLNFLFFISKPDGNQLMHFYTCIMKYMHIPCDNIPFFVLNYYLFILNNNIKHTLTYVGSSLIACAASAIASPYASSINLQADLFANNT